MLAGDAQGGGSPLVGGAGGIDACQRFLLARSVLPAWGEPSPPRLAPLGKRERGRNSLLPQAILVVAPLEDQPFRKSIAATTRCRASIRTLNEPLWARCMLRSDFKPRSVTKWNEPGLLGCCHLAIDL